MANFLVEFTDLNRLYLVENVANEADAINKAFEQAGLNREGSDEHLHVEVTPLPLGRK